MLIIGRRKLLTKSKGGAMFSIPVIWLHNVKMSPGDTVEVCIGDKGELILRKVYK